MKEVSFEQFKAGIDEVVCDILSVGDIYRVDTGKTGRFVIMEEAEYNIMHEAISAMIMLASKDKNTDA